MATEAFNNPWLVFPKPNPEARMRLFCFPHAGAGAVVFHHWPRLLPPEIEVCSIRLPGRESRLREPAFSHLHQMLEALAEVLQPSLTQRPFAFFGHSLGGLIAYELARYLHRQHGPQLLHLFVSGHRAPHQPSHHAPVHQASDPVFLKRLRDLSGTPSEIFENTQLMELMMSTLRADFSVLETYVHHDDGLLDCPISAFGGIDDGEATQSDMAAWRRHTQGVFSLRMFSGGHFFLQSEMAGILKVISRDLIHYLE